MARLVEGNQRFTAGRSLHRDYVGEAKAAAAGQYPFATVLSCIDSRSIPEIVFDQGIGDLFVPRVAGNYAPADIVGSMEFATKVAGARLVVVMGHTECGAVKGACDNVDGKPHRRSFRRWKARSGRRTRHLRRPHFKKQGICICGDALANVRRTVAKIRHDSPIMRAEMEQAGQIKIVRCDAGYCDG